MSPRNSTSGTALRSPQLLLVAGAVLLVISTIGVLFFVRSQSIMREQLDTKLRDMAFLAASEFSSDEIDQIHTKADMQSGNFREAVMKLRHIRESIPNVRYVYIMRRTGDPN